jgi:hypothetical protein
MDQGDAATTAAANEAFVPNRFLPNVARLEGPRRGHAVVVGHAHPTGRGGHDSRVLLFVRLNANDNDK